MQTTLEEIVDRIDTTAWKLDALLSSIDEAVTGSDMETDTANRAGFLMMIAREQVDALHADVEKAIKAAASSSQ